MYNTKYIISFSSSERIKSIYATLQVINKFFSKNKLESVIMIIGIVGRLIPHVPNTTPITSLSLVIGISLSHRMALLHLFAILFISDVGLSLLYGYPVFSYWTLFTYTGFMTITLASSRLINTRASFPIYIIIATLYFWIWTNFGVWLTSGIYCKNLTGIMFCYISALPFLSNSLIGDMIWGLVIFGLIKNKVILCQRTI